MPSDIQDELIGATSRRGQRIPQDVLDSLGDTQLRARPKLTLFYVDRFDSESGKTQQRDQGGRYGDEGKGSQDPGYKHPSDKAEGGDKAGGGGVDKDGKSDKVAGSEKGSKAGVPRRIVPATSDSERKTFTDAIERVHREHPFGSAVEVKGADFYKDPKTQVFLAPDKQAGVAVAPDGDLVSGFKLPTSTTDFNDLLASAAPYATHLDAFATGDGHLPELYAQHGFRPVARVPFDPKYKPANWPEALDSPDNVYMVRDLKNTLNLPDVATHGYKAVEKDIPVAKDWADAQKMQQDAITKATPTLTGLDKKIVDYKAGQRPLSDPLKLLNLNNLLPNMHYTPYTKMPFFDALSGMQALDPIKVSGADYKKSRDELLNTLPVQDIPLDQIMVTQPGVNREKIAGMSSKPIGVGDQGTNIGPIQVVRYNNQTYILNGHHRLIDFALKGASTIKAHVLKIDDADIAAYAGPAKPFYDNAAKAKPVLANVIKEVIAAHPGSSGGVAPLKTVPAAREKVEGKYDGDWSRLSDLARGRVVGDTDEHLKEITADMEKRLGIKAEIVFHPETQYSDIKFNPIIEGQKVEIQVIRKDIVEKSAKTHSLYEKQRTILRNANKEKRPLSAKEMADVTILNNQMAAIFGQGVSHAAAVEKRVDKTT